MKRNKQFSWEEFAVLLRDPEHIFRIREHLNHWWVKTYNERTVLKHDVDVIRFSNGAYTDYRFEKVFNTTVRYSDGVFFPKIRVFDEEETGEIGEDDEGRSVMIKRQLRTYSLKSRCLEIWQQKSF